MKGKTLLNEANAVRGLAVYLENQEFREATFEDISTYFLTAKGSRALNNLGRASGPGRKEVRLSSGTLAVRKQIIRQFYQWLYGLEEKEFPPQVKRLKPNRRSEKHIPVDALVSAEDMDILLAKTSSPRDRCILTVLFDGGFRAQELCNLNIGSIVFDEYGAVAQIPVREEGNKTGHRRVRLLDSEPYLRNWLEVHPRREEPTAPLFVNIRIGARGFGDRLSAGTLYSTIVKLGQRAGLKKHIHPHLFRHSGATEKARLGMTPGEMESMFGWSRGSEMPARYTHLAGRDYEEMLLERVGFKPQESMKRRALAPRQCGSCGTSNSRSALFCASCKRPISPKAEQVLLRKEDDMLKGRIAQLLTGELRGQISHALRQELEARGVGDG